MTEQGGEPTTNGWMHDNASDIDADSVMKKMEEEMLELKMEEASLDGSVNSGDFAFSPSAINAATSFHKTGVVSYNEVEEVVYKSTTTGSSVFEDESENLSEANSENDSEAESSCKDPDRKKAALLLKQAEAINDYSERMRQSRRMLDASESSKHGSLNPEQSTMQVILNATNQLREQAQLKYKILETKYEDLLRQSQSNLQQGVGNNDSAKQDQDFPVRNIALDTTASQTISEHSEGTKKKWTRSKRIKLATCVCVGVGVLLSALIVVGVLLGRERKSSDLPAGLSCNNFEEEKLASFELILQDVTALQMEEQKEDILDLLLRSYNSASGGCEGLIARVLKNGVLEAIEPVDIDSRFIRASWTVVVNCNNCADSSEPLFSEQTQLRRRLQDDNPSDMLDRFLDTFNTHLSSLLNLETLLPVVAVTTSAENGQANPLYDRRTTQSPTISTSPTIAPTSRPSLGPSQVPSLAPTSFYVGPDDQVDFMFRVDVINITSGMIINNHLFPYRVQFEVDVGPRELKFIPGVTIAVTRGRRTIVAAELTVRPWKTRFISSSKMPPTDPIHIDDAYTFAVWPTWFTTGSDNITTAQLGRPSNVTFRVVDISPSASPSQSPTNAPTITPVPTSTVQPSQSPSVSPQPSQSPSVSPAPTISQAPSASPSASPTTLLCNLGSFLLVNAETGEIIREVIDGDVIDWNILRSQGVSKVTLFANTLPEEVTLVRWYENGKLLASWAKYMDGVLRNGELGSSQSLATATDALTISAECAVANYKGQLRTTIPKSVRVRVVAVTAAPTFSPTVKVTALPTFPPPVIP